MSHRSTEPIRTPIDARRRLTPRDYAVDPYGFGDRPQQFVTPPYGDDVSRDIARLIHQLVRAHHAQPNPPSGASLARRFGFSRQTWSRVTRGHQWPGHTAIAALLCSVTEPSPDRDADVNRAASPSS